MKRGVKVQAQGLRPAREGAGRRSELFPFPVEPGGRPTPEARVSRLQEGKAEGAGEGAEAVGWEADVARLRRVLHALVFPGDMTAARCHTKSLHTPPACSAGDCHAAS